MRGYKTQGVAVYKASVIPMALYKAPYINTY